MKLTIKGKNREEIHQEQGKYKKIAGMLAIYYFFCQTDFLTCFFQAKSGPIGSGVITALTLTINAVRKNHQSFLLNVSTKFSYLTLQLSIFEFTPAV